MSRRIEIEITSISGETATWRAAGAKLPKGTLQAAMLPAGTTTGAQFRAEIEQSMESIDVLALLPLKTASPVDKNNERLQLVPKEETGPDVVVTYASKGRRGREDGEGRPRREGERRPSTPRDGDDKPRAAKGRDARRPRGDARGPRSERPAGPPMSTVHRNAFLAALTPEQLPVAEELLRGGLPGVRAAVATQNKAATEQGRPTVNAEAIDRIANDLLGKATLASWKDRAAGAQGAGRELHLRDLRAVVTSAKTVSMDDEARAMLKELQAQLNARVEHLTNEWTAKLDRAIESKNVADALLLSSKPPVFRMQIAANVASAISQMASEGLNAEVAPAQWISLLALAVESPMHRSIKPVGIPSDEACKAAAVKVAGAIPELAKLLGMKVPPPPPARPTTRKPKVTPRS